MWMEKHRRLANPGLRVFNIQISSREGTSRRVTRKGQWLRKQTTRVDTLKSTDPERVMNCLQIGRSGDLLSRVS